jgi:hypothetical protein
VVSSQKVSIETLKNRKVPDFSFFNIKIPKIFKNNAVKTSKIFKDRTGEMLSSERATKKVFDDFLKKIKKIKKMAASGILINYIPACEGGEHIIYNNMSEPALPGKQTNEGQYTPPPVYQGAEGNVSHSRYPHPIPTSKTRDSVDEGKECLSPHTG